MTQENAALYTALRGFGGYTHIALFSRNPREMYDAVVPFVRVGLERRERCILVVGDFSEDTLLEELARRAPELAQAHRAGGLVVRHADEFRASAGSVGRILERELEQARDAGCLNIRITGDSFRCLGGLDDGGFEGVDDFLRERNAAGMCQYRLDVQPPEIIFDAIVRHPRLIFDGVLSENPPAFSQKGEKLTEMRRAEWFLTLLKDRELAEAALRAGEEKYRTVVDNAADLFLLAEMDGAIFEANKKTLKALGYPRGDLLGMHLSRLHPEEELPRFMNALGHVERGGGNLNRLWLVRKDGSRLPVDLTLAVMEYGGRKIVKAVYRDATAREEYETVLRINEDLYRQMFDRSGMVNLLTDPATGGIIDANDAAAAYYGYPKDDLRRMKMGHIDALSPEEAKEEARLAGIERRVSVYSRHRLANGEIRDVEVFSSPFAVGGYSLIHLTVHDVTARRKAEAALKENEEHYRTLVSLLPDPLVVHSGGFIRFVNEATAKAFGASGPAELEGRQVMDFVHPEDRPFVKERIRTMRDEGKWVGLARERFIRLDGTPFDVEVAAMPFPYRGEKAILVVFRDISEKLRAEELIRLQEERLRHYFEGAFEGMVIHDNGVVVDANPAVHHITGHPERGLVGKHIFDMITGKSREITARHLASPTSRVLELEGIKADGTVFPIEVQGRDINYRGKQMRLVAVRDLSARKGAERVLREAKESAEKANKVKDKLVSIVSHDLRGPLVVATGYLKLLLDDGNLAMDPRIREILNILLEGNREMAALIDELLSASRLRSGRFMLYAVFVPLRPLVLKAAAVVDLAAREKGVAIEIDVPEEARVCADGPLLYQALLNLLTNAVKFTHAGGSVTVGFSPGDPAVITVADTGVGISGAALETLFDYEAKTSTAGTAGETGTGLGLPLCKDIIDAHGGGLRVESAEGRGTVFSISLPTPTPEVMAVDDDPNLLELVKDVLRKSKVKVETAANGAEAMERMAGRPPHLFIIDLYMPGIDGFALIKALKTSPRWRDIPVIALTGVAFEERDRAIALGADVFMTKQELPAELSPLVKKLFS